mmetsp:Transcript_25821/g.42188  ORF Transcript_25821/g.42188 Transcript_25821/m.42188 type:complete len:530 (-) Transcript_25821:165-1754(-)
MLSRLCLFCAVCIVHATDISGDTAMRRLLQASNGPQVVEINGQWYQLSPVPGTNTPPASSTTTTTTNAPIAVLPGIGSYNPFITNTVGVPPPVPTMSTSAPLSPGHMFGAFGQQCLVPTGVQQCEDTITYVTDQTGTNTQGAVSCSENSDCCLCKQIKCGDQQGTPCDSVQFSGIKAAYGVKDIEINGASAAEIAAGGAGVSKLECSGESSCRNTYILANRSLSEILCNGRHSCQDAEIVVENPSDGLNIQCAVTSACEGLKLTINFNVTEETRKGILPAACASTTTTEFDIGRINCVGVDGCKGMQFTVNNYGCDTVLIDTIECRSGSCVDAQWNFYGVSAVGIKSCHLSSDTVLSAASGLSRCFRDVQSLNCLQNNACANKIQTIINPVDGFKMECVKEGACANSHYTIQLTADKLMPTPETILILCNSINACQGLTVIIDNQNAQELQVEIVCASTGACDNAVFETSGAVVLPEVTCGKPEECANCVFNTQHCGGFDPLLAAGGNPEPVYVADPWAINGGSPFVNV